MAFVVATLAAFSILLFEPSLTHAVRVFVDRSIGYQLDRDSPFSPWDWGQYHARGIPSLRPVQVILQLAVLALAGVVAMIPQRKGPLELAALSAAVLVGFELTLTHWSYLYIPWFLPFVLLALYLPPRRSTASRCPLPRRCPTPRRCRRRRCDARRRAASRSWRRARRLPSECSSPRFEGGPGISDTPVYRTYGERIASGDVPVPRLPRRVPAGRARALRRCRLS